MYNLKIINERTGQLLNFSTPCSGYVITKATGLTETTVKMNTSQSNFQIGSTLQGQAPESAQMILSGVLMDEVRDKRKHMLNVLSPMDELTIIFNNTIQRTAFVRSGPTIEQYPTNANFQVTLFCPHPYWRNVKQTVTKLGGLIPGFRFPVNYGMPHHFGMKGPEQYENVINNGNVPVSFSIIFMARTTVVNPRIINVATQEFIGIGFETRPYTMQPMEIITVDMRKEPIQIVSDLQGTTTNLFNYYNMESTEFQIMPGDNLLRYDATENRGGLSARIVSADEHSGAAGDDKTI